jgi:hypothetical protein
MLERRLQPGANDMKPLSLIGIWVSGIFGAAILGAITNSINALVSQLYFFNVLHYDVNVQHLIRAIVAQGVFEGLIYGLILSTLYATVVGIVSHAKCPFAFGIRYLSGLFTVVFVCWIIGGLLAMALAWLSPEFYQHMFYRVPDNFEERLRYAWVGGSIWGIVFGGVGATFVFMALFRAAWRQRTAS